MQDECTYKVFFVKQLMRYLLFLIKETTLKVEQFSYYLILVSRLFSFNNIFCIVFTSIENEK